MSASTKPFKDKFAWWSITFGPRNFHLPSCLTEWSQALVGICAQCHSHRYLHAGLSQARVGFASHVLCEVSRRSPETSGSHQGLAEQLLEAGLHPGQRCVLELRADPYKDADDRNSQAHTEDISQHSAHQPPAVVALAEFLADLQGVHTQTHP